MGVFHWGRHVGNYELFEGLEQCLQSWLGLVVVPSLLQRISKISNMSDISPTLDNSVSGPWICPPGNRLVIGLYGFSDKLRLVLYCNGHVNVMVYSLVSVCLEELPGLSWLSI